ncbi:Pep3/Vps18/deep orange family-domain-containing protein [Hysterangium stoloniferum]|nr:Pep3/Vps18/deep orange family-domain-containing protein [Hysterangium stoloniferum]
MFDEFVEHSGASPDHHASSSLPQIAYQGFEPSPYDEHDSRGDFGVGDVMTPLETGYFPGGAGDNASIFELGRVQYAIPAPLVSLAVSSDMVAMGLSNNTIILIELAHPDQVIKVPITRKPSEMTIYKVFLDPSGRHLLVTSQQGENYYLYKGWKKPKALRSFKMVIESVAWNRPALLSATTSTSTKEILLGGRNGTIYEACLDAEDDFFKSQERYLQSVFTLQERQPITGIDFVHFPPSDFKKGLVVVTTASRIYQFVGNIDRRTDDAGKVFNTLFAAYQDTAPKFLELPGETRHSELHLFTPQADRPQTLPKSMAWLTAPGIYHGSLKFTSASPTDGLIDASQLLPYPQLQDAAQAEIPLSIGLTEFHFILLYRDKVVAVCNLDDRIAYEELLPLKPNEEVRGITVDNVRKTYWVYTDSSLFELVVSNEDRDVWKVYLEKGMPDIALQYAKTPIQRDHVLARQADAHFDAGRYIQSAQCYAQSSKSFEEVTLRFIDVGERDALRYYLISRLERTRKTDLTQRTMLATWLVEFYLSKCNQLDDLVASESVSHDVENLQAERNLLEDELRQFFETYKANLERMTVYDLILSHGRTDMYLHYATVVGDFERVIEHWVMEEEWLKAIDILNRQNNLELYYRFGPVLIRHAPKETVDSWLRQPSLDPIRLVPSLLQLQHLPRDPISPNHAVRYLNHAIFESHSMSPTIHNLLITFYASSSAPEDDGPLLRFLSSAPEDPLSGRPYYDLDYALRLCKQSGRTQPCVHIYSKMGMFENSVDLALLKGDLELAKINADKPDDDRPLKKKLWLKIAKYVVQDKQDLKTAMRFLEDTDLLKIEDILPFFPDFVVIDDFKEDICTALEGYSAHIELLKAEMDEATRSAESIKKDIADLRNRFVTVQAGERCSTCSYPLLTRQFYVFPCQHSFHADCLIGLVKEYLPSTALRRILALQTELMRISVKDRTITGPQRQTGPPTPQRTLLSANFSNTNERPIPNAPGIGLTRNLVAAGDRLRDLIIPESLASVVGGVWGTSGSKKNVEGAEGRDAEKIEKMREELDDLLASSCPLCESLVAGLDRPFITEGEVDNSWQL